MNILKITKCDIFSINYYAPTTSHTEEVIECSCYFAKSNRLPKNIDAIIALSDTQGVVKSLGNLPQLLFAYLMGHLDAMAEVGELPPLNKCMLILAGDLYAELANDKLGVSGDIAELLQFADGYDFAKILLVQGNHDVLSSSEKQLFSTDKWVFLDDTSQTGDAPYIAGIDGVIGSNGNNNRVPKVDYEKKLKQITKKTNPDILVLHEGPRLDNDEYLGHPFIAAQLQKSPIPLVISGHCCWPEPLKNLNEKTQILNVDSKFVIITC